MCVYFSVSVFDSVAVSAFVSIFGMVSVARQSQVCVLIFVSMSVNTKVSTCLDRWMYVSVSVRVRVCALLSEGVPLF